tara:strand:+ start:518 stop:1306 length:789 start_codon:yes stop_codon:yes gene_type:complete
MLTVKDLYVKLGSRPILSQIFFKINPGEITAIVGPNASGKSTLLRAINGEIPIVRGSVELRSKPINHYNKQNKSISKWRAVLPQSSNINFDFSVLDIVLMGRNPYYETMSEKENLAIAINSLNKLGLYDLRERSYLQLSGGEKQRVQFARILSQMYECIKNKKPGIIFLDEPTSNLDLKHQFEILKILNSFRESGISILIVIHNLEQAVNFSDKLLLMDKGRLVAKGNPKSVLSTPRIKQIFGVDSEWITENDQNFLKIINQ